MLHVGAFKLDIDSKQNTPWHAITPRTRLLCALLFVFAVVLTPNGHWQTWAVYGLGLLSLLLIARLTIIELLKRLAVELAFVGVVLVGTLFREGGQIIWSWGIFKVTTVGLTILASVSIKALLSLTMLNLLTLTTSVPALLHGMKELRIPPLLVATLASMYRYISVLIAEFEAMRRAALSRNLMNSNRSIRLVVGNTIGALFIRTYERGNRIHQAMLSRGYEGIPPMEKVTPGGKQDIVALTLTILLALLGQVIYWRT